jgi:hypothetical protein
MNPILIYMNTVSGVLFFGGDSRTVVIRPPALVLHDQRLKCRGTPPLKVDRLVLTKEGGVRLRVAAVLTPAEDTDEPETILVVIDAPLMITTHAVTLTDTWPDRVTETTEGAHL